jgi:hypothetical protein
MSDVLIPPQCTDLGGNLSKHDDQPNVFISGHCFLFQIQIPSFNQNVSLNLFATQMKIYWSLNFRSVVIET